MNTTDQFERHLSAMLADLAPRREPETLFDAVMAGTTTVRQRPRLLVGLRSGDVGTSPRTRFRLAPAVLIGLLLVAFAAALAIVGSRLLERRTSVPEFRATGSMTVPRAMATAVRLKDGRVLIVGGWDPSLSVTASATAEIYDPASGRFVATGSMATARTSASATLLSDGRVLVAGGFPVAPISGGRDPDPIASAEVYDPAFGTFTPVDPMRDARADHGAVLLPTGEVLVVGGSGGTTQVTDTSATGVVPSTFERFDPANGRFTRVTGTHLPIRRPSTVLLADGRLLVAGDHSSDVSIYNPNSGAVVADRRIGLASEIAVELPDGRVLMVDSGMDSGDVGGRSQIYDPTTDALGPVVSFEHGPDERGPERVVVADGGRVILFGRSYDGDSVKAIVETFDPETGRVTTVDFTSTARDDGFTVTSLGDGTVLVAGGWDTDGGSGSSESAVLLVP